MLPGHGGPDPSRKVGLGARRAPRAQGRHLGQTRLAVDAGYGHDLIQKLAFLGPGRLPIPLALDRGVLPKAGSRHGSLLGQIGNRDF